MKEVDDDDSSTFRPLAIAVASVLSKVGQLKEDAHKQAHDAPNKSASDDRKKREVKAEVQHREYVDRRLNELAMFERRARGQRFKR